MGAIQRRRKWLAPLGAWLLLEAIFAGLAIWGGAAVVMPAMRAFMEQAVQTLASHG